MDHTVEEKIVFPYIVFEVAGNLYCVNSEHISTIMQVPEHESVPDAPEAITGVYTYRSGTVTMLDLRIALHMKALEEEFTEFCHMLDERKKDHVFWVEELERTAQDGEAFTLATDPHKCKLGRWYYSFKSDIQEVNFHLHKIEEPHNKLHQAALEVEKCTKDCPNCKRAECLKKILDRVRKENMPRILGLLDETKDIFRSTVYHEMALVLNGEKTYAIIVDKVLAVEDLELIGGRREDHVLGMAKFVTNIRKSEKIQGMILELDVPALISTVVPEE